MVAAAQSLASFMLYLAWGTDRERWMAPKFQAGVNNGVVMLTCVKRAGRCCWPYRERLRVGDAELLRSAERSPSARHDLYGETRTLGPNQS